MPRFVILRHDMPPGASRPTHWDLLLDDNGVLRAWALASEPALGAQIDAHSLADHRLDYLDYEGPISGGRGSVTQYDRGEFRELAKSDAGLVVELAGEKIAGGVNLRKAEAASPADQRWIVRFVIPD